jgi:hypothetical protein
MSINTDFQQAHLSLGSALDTIFYRREYSDAEVAAMYEGHAKWEATHPATDRCRGCGETRGEHEANDCEYFLEPVKVEEVQAA